MECEYPGSCAGPTPLNPDVLPSHALRAVLTPGWSNGRGERPSLIPTFLPAPSGAEAALGGSAEVGSTPKMWINANMGPPTLTSGEAPLVFPSRSGLCVSKVLFFLQSSYGFKPLFLARFLLAAGAWLFPAAPLPAP